MDGIWAHHIVVQEASVRGQSIEPEPHRFQRRLLDRLHHTLERSLGRCRALRRARRLQHEQQQGAARHLVAARRTSSAASSVSPGLCVSRSLIQRLPPAAVGSVNGTTSCGR